MANRICSTIYCMVFFLQFFLTPFIVHSSENIYQVGFRDRMFAVDFLDKREGFAVGDAGVILCSKNGGKTWRQVTTRWNHSFNDVFFVGKEGWIVGDGGTILYTGDRGRNWKRQESDSPVSLMAVDFLDEKRGVAIGQQTILWTEDGGLLWQSSPLDWPTILPDTLIESGVISPNFYDLFLLDETHGWIVGDNGMVFFSSDRGKRWKALRIGMYPPLYSVFFKNKKEGFAAGQRGTLLHTKDGGKTWQNLNPPTDKNLFKIKMAGDYGVVTGDLGTILRTIDGGKTWQGFPLALRSPLPWFLDISLFVSNPSLKVICVGEGTIREISIPVSSIPMD